MPDMCFLSAIRSVPCQLLSSSALDYGRKAVLVFDGTAGRTTGLDTLNHTVAGAVTIGDGTEDNVAVIEPRSDNGGDEELAAIGVGAGIGHTEHERRAVFELEVFIRELFAIDGFAARALLQGVSKPRTTRQREPAEDDIRYHE